MSRIKMKKETENLTLRKAFTDFVVSKTAEGLKEKPFPLITTTLQR